jgi:hypothetical protein
MFLPGNIHNAQTCFGNGGTMLLNAIKDIFYLLKIFPGSICIIFFVLLMLLVRTILLAMERAAPSPSRREGEEGTYSSIRIEDCNDEQFTRSSVTNGSTWDPSRVCGELLTQGTARSIKMSPPRGTTWGGDLREHSLRGIENKNSIPRRRR